MRQLSRPSPRGHGFCWAKYDAPASVSWTRIACAGAPAHSTSAAPAATHGARGAPLACRSEAAEVVPSGPEFRRDMMILLSWIWHAVRNGGRTDLLTRRNRRSYASLDMAIRRPFV